MALTLADLINEMNAALPRIPRHPNRGVIYQPSRYDGHNCHCTLDLRPQEVDDEACPATLHAQTPDEA